MDREKERYDRETPEQDKRLDMAEVLSKPAGGGPGKDQDPMKETMEALKTAIGLSDLEGNLFHVNPAFLDLCGCRKKEILGRSVIEIWNNRDDGLRFLEVLREKGAHVGEETARRKGGPPFRILISAERFQDGEGDLKGMVFSFVDIEERIRNAKITAVIHEMSRAVNSTRDLKEMFGLIHRSLSRILDTRNFFIALYDRATDTISFPYFQDERDTEFSIVGAKGSGSLTAEVILAGKPRLFTETQLAERMAAPPSKRPPGKPAKVWLAVPIAVKGEVIGAVGVQSYDDPDLYTERDVSLLESVSDQVAIAIERKRTEDALRESERKYRSILESIQDGYYELDLKGRFVFFNRALTRIFGASREELWGVNIRSFADDENIQFCTRIFNKVYTTGNPVNDFEWTLVRKNGEERQVATSISLIRDSQGKVTGFQGIIRDVTDQRRLEAALQQTQKMEAIGTLAGGIAHNFNNLLMGIQGNISLMLLDADKNHPFYPRLTTMEKLVQNGSKLTSQLLGYAREGRYQLLPLDINEVVTQISETFGMTRKDIRIHRDLAGDLQKVMADRSQFEQILLNLFINAADAMPRGGDLFLVTRNVTHQDMEARAYKPKPGEYVKVSMRDTGVGMDQKTLERIFDPFFTTKGPSKGTGLGLASVYGIVKAHGGYIDVSSKQGEGTTFSIYFPAAEGKFHRESRRDLLEGVSTVLLVDDEQIILEIGEEMLKKLGYEVLVAGGGREAIDIYREKGDRIDLVILDMIMPDMGGGEVYDRLKELDPGVKVLLSSGYSIDGQAGEILERGCDGFIQKPFNLKVLSSKIREIVGD